jgi:hypothetical protein
MVNSSCEVVKDGTVVRQPVGIQPGKTIAETDKDDKKIKTGECLPAKENPPSPLAGEPFDKPFGQLRVVSLSNRLRAVSLSNGVRVWGNNPIPQGF